MSNHQTTKITKFDVAACKTLTAEVKEALDKIAAKYGLTVNCGGGKYDTGTFSPKVQFQAITAEGEPANFKTFAKLLGLPEDCYGKEIRGRQGMYRIVDLLPSRPKFCIVAENLVTGRRILFPQDAVSRQTA